MKLNSRDRPIFFTGDTHFGHKAMAEKWRTPPAPAGPFTSTDDMNRHLVDVWNATVPRDGAIVFHLGDVAFLKQTTLHYVLKQLNGDIHLIRGNHDKNLAGYNKELFKSVQDYLELDIKVGTVGDTVRAVLCHYAFRSWNRMHYGAWNLHGHSHGNLDPYGKQLDVGVDCNLVTKSLRPISFEEVANYMAAQDFVAVDHHYKEGDPQYDKKQWMKELHNS